MKKIILAVAALIIISACVKENSADDFVYIENNKKITITGYTGESKDIVIPKKINRHPVTILEDEAFAFKQLTSVVIPNTVKIIGNNTFHGNKLTELKIPRSVIYIGKYAFSWNQLTSINIPASVEFIGDFAFLLNKLTSITLPSNVEIELNAFNVFVFEHYNKNGRKAAAFDITFSDYGDFNTTILNNSIAEISSYKGRDKDITIPGMINDIPVTAIGYSAFFGNGLTNIDIPGTITIIGAWAFAGNNFENVTIPGSVTAISENAFRESAITSVNIPNSVTFIGDNAFTHNRLTNITIPNSVVSIGHQAFTYNQLTGVTIPNSVTDLGLFLFDANVEVEFE